MKTLKSFLIDFFLWSYITIILYKIVWQQLIQGNRYATFENQEAIISCLVGFFTALSLFFLKGFSFGKAYYYKGNAITPVPKRIRMYILVFALALTFITGWFVSEVSFKELFSSKGFQQSIYLFSQLFSPNLSILKKVILAAIETIYMALMATALAIPPAFVLSFLTAKNLMKKNILVYSIIRLVMNFIRSIEPLIWAIIFSVWVGIGPFAGMLALMVHSIVSLTKLYSEQIEEMDHGPKEAIRATGASDILVLWYGIVPQVLNPFLSFTIYRWDINVRMATIIGMVGGGGIGNILMQYQGLARWNEVGTVVFVIAIIVWIMDYSSAKIRERLSAV